TGSGKSYTAGVLVEELMRPYNRAAVLIVDPHGEYDTMRSIEDDARFGSGADGYRPEVRVYTHERVKVRFSSLTEADVKYLPPAGIEENEQEVVAATLVRRVNKARMATVRGEAEAGTDTHLPYPVFTLLEEAHRFAPAGQTVVSTNILKQILSEGRKFGVGIGLITQRPGKLDQDVLSQCMTQVIMRIVNPIDQDTVAKSVEGAGRQLLQELPSLTKGQ